MITLQQIWKMLFISSKSSFHPQDIQIFVFPSSSHFFPVRHCVRGWSEINLKVYDVINCLNKSSITRFVWYLQKKKRYDIETYICKFMLVNLWYHELFYFHLSFWIWKVWKLREKITKNWIYWELRELFRWNKKHLS